MELRLQVLKTLALTQGIEHLLARNEHSSVVNPFAGTLLAWLLIDDAESLELLQLLTDVHVDSLLIAIQATFDVTRIDGATLEIGFSSVLEFLEYLHATKDISDTIGVKEREVKQVAPSTRHVGTLVAFRPLVGVTTCTYAAEILTRHNDGLAISILGDE